MSPPEISPRVAMHPILDASSAIMFAAKTASAPSLSAVMVPAKTMLRQQGAVNAAPPGYLGSRTMNPVLRSVIERSVLVGLEPTDKPVKCTYYSGDERLLVVTGENATGKSLVRRALTKFARQDGLQVMDISPEGKARGGIAGAMIYGTEEDQSTGSNSARTIRKAILTARARQEPHLLVLDEPDAGLSDDYAAGAGAEIARFCSDCPEATRLVVVVSHRRSLVGELSKMRPAQLCLGGCPQMGEWLARPPFPKSLDQLLAADREMFAAVLNARRPYE